MFSESFIECTRYLNFQSTTYSNNTPNSEKRLFLVLSRLVEMFTSFAFATIPFRPNDECTWPYSGRCKREVLRGTRISRQSNANFYFGLGRKCSDSPEAPSNPKNTARLERKRAVSWDFGLDGENADGTPRPAESSTAPLAVVHFARPPGEDLREPDRPRPRRQPDLFTCPGGPVKATAGTCHR